MAVRSFRKPLVFVSAVCVRAQIPDSPFVVSELLLVIAELRLVSFLFPGRGRASHHKGPEARRARPVEIVWNFCMRQQLPRTASKPKPVFDEKLGKECSGCSSGEQNFSLTKANRGLFLHSSTFPEILSSPSCCMF